MECPLTVASLGDQFPMSGRQLFRGQEVRSKRRYPLNQRQSVLYQKTRILVCLFLCFQSIARHFWAVQFGHPCRDTSNCLCFTAAASCGSDCWNLWTLRGKWMWPFVTSCDSGLSFGLRCEVPRMAGCLPQSMWHSYGMTGGHPLPFPLLC
jgi:hypothetical protein